MEYSVQPLQSDVRRIFLYENEDDVPAPLTHPLTLEECAPFLDTDDIVTFTVKIALDEIANGGLHDSVEAAAVNNKVSLNSAEYRAVGASFEDFNYTYCGLVHIQVTCDLSAN